jgi:MFS family permease
MITTLSNRTGTRAVRGWWRGWWVVLVAMIGQSLSLGPLLVYTFGVFAKPLAREFNSNRAAIALAVSLIDIMVAVMAPVAGRLVDRFNARWVIVISNLALVACLIGLSLVTPPLWHLYALYALAGAVGTGTVAVTSSRVVANWFDRSRGLALGLSSAGVGIGIFVAPSLVQFIIDESGWRQAYLGIGVASLVIAVPLIALFLRATPQEVGLLPDGAGELPAEAAPRELPAGMAASEALRTRTFWQLCGAFFCVSACVNGTLGHLAPLLTDHGISGRQAALATSVFGAATIVGRVGNGYLVDRFFAPRVAGSLFAAGAIGLAMLWGGFIGMPAFLAAALLGLAIGAESDVMPFLISRYFGMRSMATLFGVLFGSYTVGVAIGRYLLGAGFDATGSYRRPLGYAFALLVLAVVATFMLPRYKRT